MERLPKETLLNAIDTYKTVIEAVDGKDTDYCPVLDKVTVTLLEELKAYRDAEEQIISELQESRKFYYEHQRYDEYAYVGVDRSIEIVKQVFELIEEGDAIE